MGYRKFALAAGIVLLAFGSLWFGKAVDAITAQLLGAVMLFYSGANVTAKYMGGQTGGKDVS